MKYLLTISAELLITHSGTIESINLLINVCRDRQINITNNVTTRENNLPFMLSKHSVEILIADLADDRKKTQFLFPS